MSTERRTETIPEWKREEVAQLAALIDRYESVGIVDITGIPARQLQAMRANLHGNAEIRMSRNTLIERALTEGGMDDLVGYVDGHVGLVGTNDNPFTLFRILEDSKTPAPINAGEVAPNDIVIPEGDTGMDPGPFVGDLQQVGAAAQIMDGSIKVTADSVVAEEGEVVSDDLAGVLSELGIEPKEVGLDLRAVFADGVLFEPDELELDIEAYRGDIRSAAAFGRNLSVNAAYPTARTAGALVATASTDARGLGIAAAIESPDLAADLLARADAQLRALATRIDDEEALPEALRDVAPATGTEEPTDEQDDTDTATDTEPDTDVEAEDEAEDEDDDDDEDGGDALGAMFG